MKKENCYWGYGDKYSMRPENWGRNILRTSEKLQDVKITSLDFEKVIKDCPDGSFLFIDPPYYGADQDKFYNYCLDIEGHKRLSDTLYEHRDRIKFLITYDNVPEVRELYKWALEIHDKEWNYTIARTDDQKKGLKLEDNYKGERSKGKEIFILNYDSSPQVVQYALFA
jgi:DNA adenine methylase